MDWTELRIRVPTAQLEMASAIAGMAVQRGFYVEDYSDLEAGAREIAHIDLIDETLRARDRTRATLHLYFDVDENVAEARAYLDARLSAAGIPYDVETDRVRDADWADNWKRYFKCTEVGRSLVIRPSWEPYENRTGRKVLTLDPGAAFGTGTHATTSLCLELLEDACRPGDRVLDVGTGSGILSIAAALLSNGQAVGVDIDPLAVRVARENVERNGLSDCVTILQGDLTDCVTGRFELVCANLVADLVIDLCPDLGDFLLPGGRFLCSGVIDDRAAEVEAALTANGYEILARRQRDCWFAYLTTRRELCSNLKN